jgi:hypothetical protein
MAMIRGIEVRVITIVRGIAVCVAGGGCATSPPTIRHNNQTKQTQSIRRNIVSWLRMDMADARSLIEGSDKHMRTRVANANP